MFCKVFFTFFVKFSLLIELHINRNIRMILSVHSKKLANHSANFSGLIKFLITYLVLRRSTSRAITNSSSVGITNTLTADSAVVMSPTCPKTFFSGSTSIPNQVRPSKTEARTSAEFSPIPAVKTIASAPFNTPKY